ncbi:tudor domain-containing 6 [Hippoglossus stenolepis]|uniref:tudor domain-containing 6 n=1 Tax=Hippoglossus stenolepis TaxID=195615 RepID=UPI001FAFF403|nr:tudor domain-containing 6 [Hippoglossus stenolepis]
MCSIPGLPSPGLEVHLLITRVNLNPSCGLVELWVNMDDERKHIYEQMKQEIQIPKRKFYGSEGKPGDLCLACISDTWHRARIVSIRSDAYNVFLIDHGEPHIATSEALAWAHSDSSLLPPEIESCILANVIFPENNLPERATKFLKSLPGNKFKGMVQHVLMPEDARKIILDIPNISEYICDVGVPKTIPGEDFKSLVLKCIHLLKGEASEAYRTTQEQNLKVRCQLEKHDQYLYPELLIDTFETVTVTEVTDPHSIFCRLLIFSKALKILSEQIQQHYRESSEFGEVRPQTCGDPCAARDVNGRWHRSLLKQSIMTDDGAVEVLHVDEGKTELVPVRDIRPLHGKFLRMPVVTYVCSLNGLNGNGTEWTPDQVEYLKSLILHQTLMAKFDHHDISQDVYRVTLYTANAECINGCFLEKVGLFPASKDEDEIVSIPLSSLGDEQDLQNTVSVNVDDLLGQTLPSDQNLNSNSSSADVSTTSTDDPVCLEHSDNSEHDFDDNTVGGKIKVAGTCGGVTSDEEGLLLNMVDIETPAHSVCQLLAQKCAQTEACIQTPPQVPLDAYNYSTHNIEVGGKEKVCVTSSESVGHFYCQLVRNSHLLADVMEDIKQLTGEPQCTDHPLGLSSICFARHHDDQWHRGQIVEMSPKLKVHFVDYGDTLAVDKSDICPFPSEGGFARSVPVLAVPLGLFEVPAEVPQEVNQWFANSATDQNLAILVVSKGDRGKLLVELFNGAQHVNVLVRERISKMAQQNTTGFIQQTDQLSSKSPEQSRVPNEYCSKPAPMNVSVLTKTTEENNDHSDNEMCPRDEVKINSESLSNVSATETEYEKTLDVIVVENEFVLAETLIEGNHSNSEITQLSLSPCLEESVNICMYKEPNILHKETEEVYASCVVEPHFFWCQYANTEDLNKLSILAQEAGQAQQDTVSPETLGPGSPCLAFFPSDNRWYRARVIHRTDNSLQVVFIDYGNESDIDIKNVRSLPQTLLDVAPQAFLCSLNGFDESKGSWDDQAYDDFYNLLVDKALRVTVLNMEDHSEMDLPQYSVQLECENVVVNDTMQKYWKPVAEEQVMTESPRTKDSLQVSETLSDQTELHDSKEKPNTCVYKKPEICKNQAESVYASCVVEPCFFWCQYTNSEDLNKLSILAQEAGQAQQDTVSPETLGPGSPCLAFFSSDNQWYRARVIHRTDDSLHVVFIDYGNESDIDIKNVRSLPQTLLDVAPQAFLCSLNGFDESKGSWDDQVYDDFYNLLVDKPLRVTVLNMEDHSEMDLPQYSVQLECENLVVNDTMQKYWKPVATEQVMTESPRTKDSLQVSETESNQIQLHDSEEKPNTCMYKKPEICKNQAENVYASCVVEPCFFWCQYTNSEDLNKLSILAQEAGQAQQDTVSPETLGPGSPCLAFFPSDNRWYRARVIHRTDYSLHVVFIDYGNESDIDINNVRSLPQTLLDVAPQAFLCSLNGFDESKGSWDDQVYDDFYNLLVDKPLRVTVLNMEDHSEMDLPQYAVELECEGVVVNEVMEKYWKGLHQDPALAEGFESVHQDETKPTYEVVGV